MTSITVIIMISMVKANETPTDIDKNNWKEIDEMLIVVCIEVALHE